ncbi:hypothetical protein DIPPA_33341 [Diplonema papillatum]|nr:hypothetical protein DIPPA_33341 [Diplonema papillatum]
MADLLSEVSSQLDTTELQVLLCTYQRQKSRLGMTEKGRALGGGRRGLRGPAARAAAAEAPQPQPGFAPPNEFRLQRRACNSVASPEERAREQAVLAALKAKLSGILAAHDAKQRETAEDNSPTATVSTAAGQHPSPLDDDLSRRQALEAQAGEPECHETDAEYARLEARLLAVHAKCRSHADKMQRHESRVLREASAVAELAVIGAGEAAERAAIEVDRASEAAAAHAAFLEAAPEFEDASEAALERAEQGYIALHGRLTEIATVFEEDRLRNVLLTGTAPS